MRIWCGYGSDHSSNLVLIGKFKTVDDAKRVECLIEKICLTASEDVAEGIIDAWQNNERYSEITEKQLRSLSIYNLSPSDIAEFGLVQPTIRRTGDTLKLNTDESEIGGIVKFMVTNGARVEVYSAYDYPDQAPPGKS